MTLYAKVVDGAIVSRENKVDPVSKTASDGGPTWRPIVHDSQPAYDFITQKIQSANVINQTEVRVTYTAVDKPIETARADLIAQINSDAGALILEIMPEYKQRNALALGLDLVTTYGSDPASWPAERFAAYQAHSANWLAISAIRDVSNAATASVDEAASVDAMRLIYSGIVWP